MRCKKFIIQELVPPEIYQKRGEQAWKLINQYLIMTLDTLKEKFPEGSITINDWKWGGKRVWSGIRTSDSPYYSNSSQHSYGMAADCIFNKYNVNEVRQYIIDHPEEFPYVKGIEKDVSWLHIDVRNADTVEIFGKN